MTLKSAMLALLLACGVSLGPGRDAPSSELDRGFADPPRDARVRAYWWWLNGNVTKGAITRDLEWMKRIGMGGALIFDAGGAEQFGHDPVPAGPLYGSPEWRELLEHALREADRLGLEMSLSPQSGWNLGGPGVRPEDASKRVVWAGTTVRGPSMVDQILPVPPHRLDFYRDIAVMAYRPNLPPPGAGERPKTPASKPIRQLDLKAGTSEMGGSAPDGTVLLKDDPGSPDEAVAKASEVIDLTSSLDADGRLRWDVPEGDWQVLRFGYTNNGAHVSTSSGGWRGLVVDYLDPDALRSYWRRVVEPLLADAGGTGSHALRWIQTDSWELGGVNWTANFAEEFRRRRGYDLRPYLPVLAGAIVDSREISNRFLNDFRKTIGDCVADNHYGVLATLAHEHGLGIHPESGGPHGGPFDALKCLGRNDFPMTEFWVPSPHRPTDRDRFFVKQAACAAHTYGKRLVAAEGFTSIGPQWNDLLWRAQKPSFDHEACAGLNRVFWHTLTCSPPEAGLPGQEYFAGTHFNPNLTWAEQAHAFVGYLNRCQFLLQQGRFAADALYYYGDHVPNFVRFKEDDPARVLPGYDYDVCDEEVLLTRLRVRDGRLELPDGMSYLVLVLPDLEVMSLEALRAIHRLVRDGATAIGPRPRRTTGLRGYPGCDSELKALAKDLWGDCDGMTKIEHRFGRGRVFWGKTAREVLAADGLRPDFEFTGTGPDAVVDSIHRTDSRAEIFFISNQGDRPEVIRGTFRVSGRQPELWDPLTGEIREAVAFRQADGCTTLPLELAPYGSLFVLFRRPIATDTSGGATRNFPAYSRARALGGPWDVAFDPKWGGPASVEFPQLVSWTTRPEVGIRYYSGTATYRKSFDLPTSLCMPGRRLALDLGEVRNIAEVRLNGKPLGVLWSPPFRVEITGVARPSGNVLEIEVTNTWYNRLVGDSTLPPGGRFTRTNIRVNPQSPPEDSGLLGPVTIHLED
jgi:hypothetical protein